MVIARLIAEPDGLAERLDAVRAALAAKGWPVSFAGLVEWHSQVLEIELAQGDAGEVRAMLDAAFPGADMLVAQSPITVPQLFVSDMDSTMIAAECIDELADFAGLKPQIAAITERAMQGELDFESALRERVRLLAGLPESAIAQCLTERIAPMPGAKTLVATLRAHGCRTVLVTGGFHQFADPVAADLGFEMVVANRLEIADGVLTGGLVGPICDSGTKLATLQAEAARLGEGTISLATGDGANDIPMIAAATYGVAYRAKPKARAAAHGWIEHGDLTALLALLGIAESDWVRP